MSTLAGLPGFRDFYPADLAIRTHIMNAWREAARRHGFEEYDGPPLEPLELYTGKSGEEIVSQLYSFEDKGGDPLTLRPEYTAGICRAFITHGLYQNVPFKVFAHGPMFRYERPQKGRYRQFHQLDIEVIGAAEPQCDVEVIAVGADILEQLGVLRKCTLEINSLGDPDSRAERTQFGIVRRVVGVRGCSG